MIRQQKICDSLLNIILMPTTSTHQLPLHNLRLHQQRMKILNSLLIELALRLGRRKCRKSKLFIFSSQYESYLCALNSSSITSLALVTSAGHSIRGRMFLIKSSLISSSSRASSASRKWSGNESGEDLQALTAQVR